MIRHHQRLFGHLAFVAMLLLASVPTLGRLLAPTPGAHAHTDLAPAGMWGMAMPAMAHARGAVHATPSQSRHPTHQHDDDCAYCALLGATVPTLASAPAFPPSLLPDVAPWPWQAPRQRALPRGALGSRGPPAHG